MAVYLQNLSARAPLMGDLEAVTRLISVCDIAEHGMSDCKEEDILAIWEKPGFNLKTDAWVIVTKEQLVGYAVVWHDECVRIYTKIVVHPDYRGRGIGTLLLRQAEHRARAITVLAQPGLRVTISSTVSQVNKMALQLLEREGYALVRNYWRIVIEIDGASGHAHTESNQHGKLKVALDIDSQRLTGATSLYEHDGVYVIRQYAVHEKELRPGEDPCTDGEICDELVLV